MISLRRMKLRCKTIARGRSAAMGPIATGRSVVKKVPWESRIYQTDSKWLRVGMWSSAREVDKRETSDTLPRPILLLSRSSQPRLVGLEGPEATKLFEVSNVQSVLQHDARSPGNL